MLHSQSVRFLSMKGCDKVEHDNNRLDALRNNTSVFRIAFVIDLLICQIGYISVPAIVIAVFLFLWGLSIFFKNYVYNLNIKKVNYYGWLVLFVATNILTVIIRGYSDGIWLSVGMILFLPVIFFVFYGLHIEARTDDGRKKIYKEIYVLCNILLWLSLAINIVSLITLYTIGKSISYVFGYLVVYENRFTGIYYNPNLMAFTSFCAAFGCHILWQGDFVRGVTGKPLTKVRRAIILVSALLNVFVIFLTDSNAAILIIVCYTIAYICYRWFGGKEIHFGILFKRALALIVGFVAITATIFALRYVTQTGATQVMSSPEPSVNVFEDRDDELNKITFEHENKNIDSGRIKLFKQGVNVIKHHPFFGVGKGNVTIYGNRYNNNKMKYSDLHNGYLTIIVCSGFLGFILFLGFAVCLGWRMVRIIFTVKPTIKSDIFPCMASFIAAYCVYAFFEKTLIYDVTIMTTFFWLVLGYAAVCMERYEGEDFKLYAFSSLSLFKKRQKK